MTSSEFLPLDIAASKIFQSEGSYRIVPARIQEVQVVDTVFSGFPVRVWQLGSFALYTSADRQFVAYYDDNRQLRVASRQLGTSKWTRVTLPEQIVTTTWLWHLILSATCMLAATCIAHLFAIFELRFLTMLVP